MRYVKRPVEIEARYFSGLSELIDVYELAKWCGGEFDHDTHPGQELKTYYWYIKIPTLEGVITAKPGDYIIKGIKGEFYPCRGDIFDATYSEAEDVREDIARAMALTDDYDGCFERIDEWEALEQWEREANPEEEPLTDREDAEWWLKRADSVLKVLRGEQ